jgi:hypothetical protein
MTERQVNYDHKEHPISIKDQYKAYTVAHGIWKERGLIPVTHDNDCEAIIGIQPMIIPLVGGDFIELGRIGDGSSGDESIYFEVNTRDKDGRVNHRFGTNFSSAFSSKFGGIKGYDFWMFYDNPGDSSQVKVLKYLAGLNPVRKFDWDHIKPGTKEMEIALSISQMAFESQRRWRGSVEL